eukprot:15444984-Alexandrium_andersonii.AAC.1
MARAEPEPELEPEPEPQPKPDPEPEPRPEPSPWQLQQMHNNQHMLRVLEPPFQNALHASHHGMQGSPHD